MGSERREDCAIGRQCSAPKTKLKCAQCKRPCCPGKMCSRHLRRAGAYVRLCTSCVPLLSDRPERPSTCCIDGCGRKRHRREWCETHYYRWRTTGDVQADEPILTTAERNIIRNKENAYPIGATRVTENGYIMEKISKSDPMIGMANQSSGKDWVMRHRLLVARSIGRPLTKEETVHHINGIEDDNRLENLELWESRHPRGARSTDPHCRTCTCMKGIGGSDRA